MWGSLAVGDLVERPTFPKLALSTRSSHLWEFDSLADIEERRAAIAADPEFKKYLDATDGMVVAQEDRIGRRVPFKSLP